MQANRFQTPSSWLTALIFVLGTALVIAVGAVSRKAVRYYERLRFESEAEGITDEINARMGAYIGALNQTAGLFHVDPALTREEFQDYVASTGLTRNFPGTQGVGFAAAENGGTSFPIRLLEPAIESNRRMLGFDMASEARRRQAILVARDSGHPSATAPLTLTQTTQAVPSRGFLIYVPVYRKGAPTDSVLARRRALLGFVYSPFHTEDLFRGIFGEALGPGATVDFAIFDGNDPLPERGLIRFESGGDASRRATIGPVLAKSLTVAGRTWLVRMTPGNGLRSRTVVVLPTVAMAVSGLLLLFVLSLKTANDRERAFRRRAEFLAEASRILSHSLETPSTLKQIAGLAVPEISTWCSIDLLDGDGPNGEKRVRNVAMANADPRMIARALQLREVSPPTLDRAAGLGAVLRTGQAEFYPRVTPGIRDELTRSPEEARIVRELGVRSYLVVPLIARGRILGALGLASARRAFQQEDLAMAQELADRIAIAVENVSLYESAQNAVKVREEFLSIASHELKTPLTPLKLHLELIHRRITGANPISGERVDAMILTALKSVDRLRHLVEDLLDVSRIANAKMSFELEPTDLPDLVRDVVSRFEYELRHAHSEARISIPPRGIRRGHWDRFRIEQVVVNLLTNAIKYGAGKPVEIAVDEDHEQAVLRVRDYGIGIATEDQRRIFNRFERVLSVRNISGLGLGLYIAQMIVQAHGGTIDVRSTPGEGAEFIVRIPFQATPELLATQSPAPLRSRDAS